jgi:uncharacterized protein YdcH (DUF465 family)
MNDQERIKELEYLNNEHRGVIGILMDEREVLRERIAELETQTKPLSDEEIIELFENPDDFSCIEFARAIEERHGIK